MTNAIITDEQIAEAIESNTDTSYPDTPTVAEIRGLLSEIQTSFEHYWGEHMDTLEEGHIELIHEGDDVLVFADHTGHGWNEELNALNLDRDGRDGMIRRVLSQIHHTSARSHTDHSWDTSDPFVITKPESFEAGQQLTEAVVNHFMNRGLSPGQAWAVYGVKIRGNSRNMWASRCGYSDHSAVSEAYRKAAEKIPL